LVEASVGSLALFWVRFFSEERKVSMAHHVPVMLRILEKCIGLDSEIRATALKGGIKLAHDIGSIATDG
jgi:hypothetical protein